MSTWQLTRPRRSNMPWKCLTRSTSFVKRKSSMSLWKRTCSTGSITHSLSGSRTPSRMTQASVSPSSVCSLALSPFVASLCSFPLYFLVKLWCWPRNLKLPLFPQNFWTDFVLDYAKNGELLDFIKKVWDFFFLSIFFFSFSFLFFLLLSFSYQQWRHFTKF